MGRKKRYLVVDGIDHVAGMPVPEDRIVRLTDAEALYEKGLGRLVAPPRSEPTTAPEVVPAAEPVAIDND